MFRGNLAGGVLLGEIYLPFKVHGCDVWTGRHRFLTLGSTDVYLSLHTLLLKCTYPRKSLIASSGR